MIYYFKFNYIEYFWYDSKFYTLKNCTYTIEKLREIISITLKNDKHSTIFGYYKIYIKEKKYSGRLFNIAYSIY